MNVLIPLSAKSSFFPEADFPFPKPLIEIEGTTMIERVVENLKSIDPDIQYTFVVSQEDVANFSFDKTLQLVAGDCNIVTLRAPTEGALCSCLMAIDQIDREAPLVVVNGDQIISSPLDEIMEYFSAAKADAGVVSFPSVHPRWSFVKVGEDKTVFQAEEKKVISKDAIAGFYYFRTGQIFIDAAMATIENDKSVNGSFYIAPCLNEVIIEGMTVKAFPIAGDQYHSFYSPLKINEFEDRLSRNESATPTARPSAPVGVNVIIPAAGQGSRFAEAGYEKPKPYIDVAAKPMIEHVIENVSVDQGQVCLLLRKEHVEKESGLTAQFRSQGHDIVEVDALTEGTVCTVLLARSKFDNETPLLIANSDQFVDFDCQAFVDDCIDRDLDGAILAFKEPMRDPKWSYVKVDENGIATQVAEKNPISDLATVGIYFFRRGSDFVKAAVDMIALNDRVNNEFYTCPIYNYMIKEGLRIGVYEVPMQAMHGLGTPADLKAFLALKAKEK